MSLIRLLWKSVRGTITKIFSIVIVKKLESLLKMMTLFGGQKDVQSFIFALKSLSGQIGQENDLESLGFIKSQSASETNRKLISDKIHRVFQFMVKSTSN